MRQGLMKDDVVWETVDEAMKLVHDIGHKHQYRPSCGKISDVDMVLVSSPRQNITMATGGCAGHPDCHGPCCSMTLEHQCGPKWQPRPQASAQPPAATFSHKGIQGTFCYNGILI